jgi:F-type H+-transporting ATPase subunit epsilon
LATVFHVSILTANQKIFDGEATSLVARGRDGYFGILAQHAPLIASLIPGKLTLKDGSGREQCFCTSSGLLDVADNQVTILVRSAELPEDIDYARACRAEERARKQLGSLRGEGFDLDRFLRALLRAINRKNIAEEFGHGKPQS